MCFRLWRGAEAMSSMLVRLRQHLSEVELLWLLAVAQAVALHHCHGPIRRPWHYHLYCPQYRLHGYGALSNDGAVRGATECWKSGQWRKEVRWLFWCRSQNAVLYKGAVSSWTYSRLEDKFFCAGDGVAVGHSSLNKHVHEAHFCSLCCSETLIGTMEQSTAAQS